jgi:hypothetical protein
MKTNGMELEVKKEVLADGRSLIYAVTHAISRLLMLSVKLRSLSPPHNPPHPKLSHSAAPTNKTVPGICTVYRLGRRLVDCVQQGVKVSVDNI